MDYNGQVIVNLETLTRRISCKQLNISAQGRLKKIFLFQQDTVFVDFPVKWTILYMLNEITCIFAYLTICFSSFPKCDISCL
jgi:hypothetical protein